MDRTEQHGKFPPIQMDRYEGPLCIRPVRFPTVDSATQNRIGLLADEIKSRDPKISDTTPFGPAVRKGCGAGTGVWFGDAAEIPLMALHPSKRFDYRLAWLAAPKDIVVIGGQHCAAFEDYQRYWLSSPDLSYLNVAPDAVAPRQATTKICLGDVGAYDRLLSALKARDGATLYAHLTTGTVWALASRLAADTGGNVHVAGPPPLLSKRANDKLWFGKVLKRLFGSDATPPKRAAYSISALTRHVIDLARKWDRLVIKLPDSAGSAGNFPLFSSDIRDLNANDLRDRLIRMLSIDGRIPRFPMLVEVWDTNVLTSPSVQVWIPNDMDQLPIIEGIFEQILGHGAAFSGAAPARLPSAVDEELSMGAMTLALLFQKLGYFGRCSFDTVLTGTSPEASTIHWIECNARWGGVSIPMSLVNRLTAPGTVPHFHVYQCSIPNYRPVPFAKILEEFSELTPPTDFSAGVLFLSPNMMEAGLGAHFLSFGIDEKGANRQAQKVLGS